MALWTVLAISAQEVSGRISSAIWTTSFPNVALTHG